MPALYFSLTTRDLDSLVPQITAECETVLRARCLWVRPGETAAPQIVRRRLAECDAMILVLGRAEPPLDAGSADPVMPALNERVRFEIVTAIHRDLLLLPVLVDDARIPDTVSSDRVWEYILNARPRRLLTANWREHLHELLDALHDELEFRRKVSGQVQQATGAGALAPVTDETGAPVTPPRLGLEFSQPELLQRKLDSERYNLETARRMGDRAAEKHALSELGFTYAKLGQTQRAIRCFEQQLPIVREFGDAEEECSLLGDLGDAYAMGGDLSRARQCYEEQLCRADTLNARPFIASAYNGLGHVHVKRGEVVRAIDCYRKALAHYRDLEDHDKVLELLVGIGLNQQKTGAWREAAESLEDALTSAKFVENRKEEARVHVDLAETYSVLQEPVRARGHLDAAQSILNRFEGDWTRSWIERIASLRNTLP